jgi:hypothetical protein
MISPSQTLAPFRSRNHTNALPLIGGDGGIFLYRWLEVILCLWTGIMVAGRHTVLWVKPKRQTRIRSIRVPEYCRAPLRITIALRPGSARERFLEPCPSLYEGKRVTGSAPWRSSSITRL